MSSVRVVCFSQKCYERILSFLYPTYSVLSAPMVCSEFITWRDIADRSEREQLDYMYSDCVFISKRLFDELWTEEVIIREVLDFVRRRFGSRRRSFRPVCAEGDGFIDECVAFMFSGSLASKEEDDSVLGLFESYGSARFVSQYVSLAVSRGVRYVYQSMGTFVSRILHGSDKLFYKKAALRLRGSVGPSVEGAVLSSRLVNDYYRRHFPELCHVWFFMNLCKRQYFGS